MTNQETEKDQPPSSLLNKIKRFFTIKPTSLDDVSVLLEDALSARLIDKEAQFIAERAIRLGDTTVKEIMVPRVEMVILAPDEDPMGMIARIIDSGHSRYPVLGPAKNEVQGILLAKDLLPIINKDLEDFNLRNLIRDIKVVPESKKADSLLEEFKKDRSHMAIVIDEYGTISGLVTIEDILEELVGEIEDEHDSDDEDLIQVSEYEYIADATLELSEFEAKFNKNFNGMDAETLAGLFINKLGFLPKVGDKIELDDIKPSSRVSPYIIFNQSKELFRNVLEVKDLNKNYDDEQVLRDINLMIETGERVAIIGQNGIGKSTLLKTLFGEVEPDSGSKKWSENSNIGYYAQDHNEEFEKEMSVLDWMTQFKNEKDDIQMMRSVLGKMLFGKEDVKKSVKSLSGGEKGRMIFGRLMLQKPNILLMDEPTNHLDMESIEALNLALDNYKGTLVFVSHDREFVSSLSTKVIELKDDGAHYYSGNYEDYLLSQV